ncbi:cytochrome b-245 light chain-like [Liolophura sinensis]|uniref:cytochrome b-245 light chain-like n=1 Tax=Liolophura sinensis TaxID=3198878 RepID=UPI0031587E9D
MGQIEWAMWANEQAIVSSVVTILGGIIAIAGQFNRWQIGIYAISVGFLVFLLEYPRGKRQKGNTIERMYQQYMTRVIRCGGPVTRNYYVRFVLHLVICVPLVFILPTLLGGASLLITSAIYFVAAIKGEEWKPVGLDRKQSPSKKAGPKASISRPPKRAPPRGPQPAIAEAEETELPNKY